MTSVRKSDLPCLIIWLSHFVDVFLGCTSTGWMGLCFLWFFVQELPKAQPAVVLDLVISLE